jgi:tripartite-type tricarboxylate transporter receptor subunit TctC
MLLGSTALQAQGTAWPGKPIRWIVPYPPGGITDNATRMVLQKVQEQTGWTIVVENKPGANSILGADLAAKAAPDGYTFLTVIAAHAANATLYAGKLPFDTVKSFAPLSLVGIAPLIMTANNNLPVKDVKELIAYAKANPRKLAVGTAGLGSPHHLAAAWLNTAAKIEIMVVPYRGAAPALNDLLGGQIPLIWALPVSAMPFVEQGKVKALGVSTQQRFASLPQLPTVAESAVPGFDIDFFYGIAAPANLQPGVVGRVSEAIHEITELPDVRERMSTLGMSIHFRNSDQFRDLIAKEYQKYGVIVHEAGIQPD